MRHFTTNNGAYTLMETGMTPKTQHSAVHGNGEHSPSDTVLSSARVIQLKREIEDLDARLAKTNTINFEDVEQ